MTRTKNNSSKGRIQQLLAAIGSNARSDGAQVEALDYDWHQPHFFTSQQTKKLAAFTTKTASLIAEKFGALCQHSFEVTITSTSEHFAGQFLGQAPAGQSQNPGNYYLPFRLGQETPCGFVSIPPQTAVVWATQLLGDAESKDNSARSLSDLEATFLFDMASLIVKAITETGEKSPFSVAADSLTDVLPLQLKGEEEFCKITFQVKKTGSESATADKPGSEAHILILCEKLAMALGENLLTAGKFTPETIARAMQHHIEKIPVPVTLQLACVPVSVEEILNLNVGDVLLLDKKITEPAQLIAAGKTVCRGLCAKVGGNYALSVTDTNSETNGKNA
jgi:flagellar motor switch protein FliM